jgi:hypothetical protein
MGDFPHWPTARRLSHSQRYLPVRVVPRGTRDSVELVVEGVGGRLAAALEAAGAADAA